MKCFRCKTTTKFDPKMEVYDRGVFYGIDVLLRLKDANAPYQFNHFFIGEKSVTICHSCFSQISESLQISIIHKEQVIKIAQNRQFLIIRENRNGLLRASTKFLEEVIRVFKTLATIRSFTPDQWENVGLIKKVESDFPELNSEMTLIKYAQKNDIPLIQFADTEGFFIPVSYKSLITPTYIVTQIHKFDLGEVMRCIREDKKIPSKYLMHEQLLQFIPHILENAEGYSQIEDIKAAMANCKIRLPSHPRAKKYDLLL